MDISSPFYTATVDEMKAAILPDLQAIMNARLLALDASQALRNRLFTVQDGGSDPLFSYDTTSLPNGTIVTVSDLGGCGMDGVPGKGLCVWMGEWRRLSRGVPKTLAPGNITLDAFKDPMRIVFNGSLLTTIRTQIARPFLGGRWSFVRPGLGALTNALGVGLLGTGTSTDIVLVGASVNFVEYIGNAFSRVDTE